MENASRPSVFRRMAPAFTLALLAPLLAEILPGATRFSAIFVFPIEVCVWGIGAVLIREVVRRKGLGWPSLLLLALVLAIAEECLIQQTSLAPLVIQLKGQVYARAFGVNYVYLLWALIYESVYVVLLPILLAELIFPARRSEGWMSKAGHRRLAGASRARQLPRLVQLDPDRPHPGLPPRRLQSAAHGGARRLGRDAASDPCRARPGAAVRNGRRDAAAIALAARPGRRDLGDPGLRPVRARLRHRSGFPARGRDRRRRRVERARHRPAAALRRPSGLAAAPWLTGSSSAR